MDQGDAAIWASGITAVVGFVAAACAYGAGKAQAEGVREGVKLQLKGQREDALWQAELDAHAEFATELNHARMKIANTASLFEARDRDLSGLAALGYGTREQAFAEMAAVALNCVHLSNLLRLRTSPENAENANRVRIAMSDAVEALNPWCVARSGGPGDAPELKEVFDLRMTDFREALDRFVEDAQSRFSSPRT